MALDSRIPLMGNTQEVFDSVNRNQNDLARIGLAQKQEQRMAKSAGIQDELNQEQLVKTKFENLDARQKSRVQSVILGAAELGTYLESGDTAGAENFLNNRKKMLQKRIAAGEDIDTAETDAAIKMLKENPDMLKKQVEASKQFGYMTGVLSQPKATAGAGMVPSTDPVTGEVTYGPTRKLSATDQKEIYEASDSVQSAGAAISALQRAKTIMKGGATGKDKKPYSGFGAGLQADVARVPIVGDIVADKERGAATTEYSTLVNEQALNNMKAIFGGNPTEGERQVLLQMQAIADYTPQEQERIIDNAIKAAERRTKFNQGKIKSIQTGDYGALGAAPKDDKPSGNAPWGGGGKSAPAAVKPDTMSDDELKKALGLD